MQTGRDKEDTTTIIGMNIVSSKAHACINAE